MTGAPCATTPYAAMVKTSASGSMSGRFPASREARSPFMSWRTARAAGVPARVMRISFSGELSYEVNVPSNAGAHVWNALMEAGKEFGITPYGTETMHVLRAEKGYIIVGQDTDGSISPHDLGMGGMVSKTKDFLGRRSLARSDTARSDRKQLVGLLTDEEKLVLPEGTQLTLVDTAHNNCEYHCTVGAGGAA